jgi:lipopolysaccharide/colanic/teichoic acid biosynthesis glycosyltransferase
LKLTCLRVVPQLRAQTQQGYENRRPRAISARPVLRNDLSMVASQPGRLQLIAKRAFDIIASALVLVVLSPLLTLVSLAIKLESPGPIFFVTRQYCYNNRIISVPRFRCTRRRSVTFVGNVLTRAGLDMLPMLINVLRGDMSIVGPRCHSALPSTPLSEPLSVALRESSFKPGLISFEGSHDRANSDLRNIGADLFYISNWSLLLDAKIILLTFFSPKHRVSTTTAHLRD